MKQFYNTNVSIWHTVLSLVFLIDPSRQVKGARSNDVVAVGPLPKQWKTHRVVHSGCEKQSGDFLFAGFFPISFFLCTCGFSSVRWGERKLGKQELKKKRKQQWRQSGCFPKSWSNHLVLVLEAQKGCGNFRNVLIESQFGKKKIKKKIAREKGEAMKKPRLWTRNGFFSGKSMEIIFGR